MGEKLSFEDFWSKGLQNKVFQACQNQWNDLYWFFLLHELAVAQNLKIDSNDFFFKVYEKLIFRIFLIFLQLTLVAFFSKTAFLSFLDQKELNIGPKWSSSEIIKSQCMRLFWCFAWFLKFLGRNELKVDPKWGFSHIIKSQCMEIFWFFKWSCSSMKA